MELKGRGVLLLPRRSASAPNPLHGVESISSLTSTKPALSANPLHGVESHATLRPHSEQSLVRIHYMELKVSPKSTP